MQSQIRVRLPAVCQPFRSEARSRDVVDQIGVEVMADVEIRIAVVALEVVAVLGQRSDVLGDLVQTVRPGVGERGNQPLPLALRGDASQSSAGDRRVSNAMIPVLPGARHPTGPQSVAHR